MCKKFKQNVQKDLQNLKYNVRMTHKFDRNNNLEGRNLGRDIKKLY